ncbi:hypothetical protein V6N13_089854 [Hibiscus sabdariffa]
MRKKVGSSLVKVGQSYKDVLLGKFGKDFAVESKSSPVGAQDIEDAKFPLAEVKPKSVSCSVPDIGYDRSASAGRYVDTVIINDVDLDKRWLDNCLIVQITAIYDAELVQQLLVAEGFKVKVIRWIGFYVVICFEEEEQVSIFWDLKESLLKPWFSDIDTVESFMDSYKLKVWVCIEGLPLEAWTEPVIRLIGGRWGKVIQVDADTVNRNRVDAARILIGVKCLSNIPPFISVSLNGSGFLLKVSTSEFEDERCWIDEGKSDGRSEYSPKSRGCSPGWLCMGKSKDVDPQLVEHDNESFKIQKDVGDELVILSRENAKPIKFTADSKTHFPQFESKFPSPSSKSKVRQDQ